jgi:hypothetical protein
MVFVKLILKYFNFGARKPKGLIRIAKMDQGHICPREEKLSFDNNFII